MTAHAITRRRALQSATAALAVAALPTNPANASPPSRDTPADLIIHNGRIRTMDDLGTNAQAGAIRARFPALDRGRDRPPQALAVRHGRIIAIGSERELRHLRGRRTQLLDAGGSTVLPGINDSHLHLSSWGLTAPPLSVDVDTTTLAELVARVADTAASTPAGAWIRGRNWSELKLERPPTRHDLDPVTGDRPTILTDFTLHAVTCNTAALRLAGITASTSAPAGGVIERDSQGEPTGVLREGATALLQAVVPPYTTAELRQAITAATAALAAQGVTSITEPGITPQLLALYDHLACAGLPVRVTALLDAGSSRATMRAAVDAARVGLRADPRLLTLAGVKIFADGVPTFARTAWVHEPYDDGSHGAMTIAGTDPAAQVAVLRQMIDLAHRAGLQVGTHACGDATVDAVVAAYLTSQRRSPRPGLRHYVIHGDLVTGEALHAMAHNGIGVSMNSEIKFMIDRVLAPVLGDARTDRHWPYAEALRAGVRVATGSDAPVVDPDWRRGVAQMVTRQGSAGSLSGPEQRISLTEALATYTTAAAWQDRAEHWKGTLAVGRAADLCLLGADLNDVDPHDVPQVPVAATVMAGRVTHDRAAAAGPAVRMTRTTGPAREAYAAGACCCSMSKALHGGTDLNTKELT
ncbi:amidohydrolase [Catellatospora methionotrophica]|uniref:amidohydrolase n=1 Tax=Catellatospora methionotrophica TaxID=121620 RepID=UPI0033E0EB8D